jgi:hypothetical protein
MDDHADDCIVVSTDALAKNRHDWTVFPSTRRKIYRTFKRPCLLCCGEAVAVQTRVAPDVLVVEVAHNARLLTCVPLCQTCRLMPCDQQQRLIDAALALEP